MTKAASRHTKNLRVMIIEIPIADLVFVFLGRVTDILASVIVPA
jgi:hypothetical protein